MRNLKRALSLALASVMLVGMMVVGTSASYPDVTSENNEEAIAVMQMLGVMTGDEKGNFICSYADFLTIAGDYVITATGVYGAGYKAAVLLNPQVFLPGKPANNTSGYVEATLRAGSYNYRFDWLALTGMGFTMTEDLAKANVIVGSQKLSDEALGTVNPGTPGETGKPDAPKTGDTGNIIVWVLAASFTVAMIPVTVTLKRKSR